MRSRIAAALLTAATMQLGVVASLWANAPSINVKAMTFSERERALSVTASFTEIIDKDAYDRLSSGFATTIVVRLYVYKQGHEDAPIAYVMASSRIVYDLWDQVYVVRNDSPSGRETRRFRRRSDALRALTELHNTPVAPLARIEIGPYYLLAMVVELNPVSSELLAEMRRWLTKPAGTTSLDRSSSFFGSFVSVFVNPKLPEADRVLRIQSQLFYRPKR